MTEKEKFDRNNEIGFNMKHLFWHFYTSRLYSKRHWKYSPYVIVWMTKDKPKSKFNLFIKNYKIYIMTALCAIVATLSNFKGNIITGTVIFTIALFMLILKDRR